MVFYFYGDNSYAIKRQVDAIKERYLEKTKDSTDLLQLDLAEKGLDSLIENIEALPMFVSSRLIIATNISLAKPTEQQLNKIIEATPESTNLVLIDPDVDKRTMVFKRLSKIKQAKEFRQLARPQLIQWVLKEANLANLSLAENEAQYLIERGGEDQWRLYNDIQKLSSYGGKITKRIIDNLVSPSLDNTAFDLADALVKKDLRRALNLYQQLLLDGQADPAILGAIIYQYRMILLSKLASSELVKAYGASSYAIQKARQINSDIDLEDIRYIYQQIREADIATKTGVLNSNEAMKQMFYRLCNRQS
jgi:DNA polymerase-3 subunit delta